MKSRKVVDINAYGEAPISRSPAQNWSHHVLASFFLGDSPYATIPGTDIRIPEGELAEHSVFKDYTREQFIMSAQKRGAGWYGFINVAVVEARENNKNVTQAELDAVRQMMEEDYGAAATTATQEAA